MAKPMTAKAFFDSVEAKADEMVDIGEMAKHIGISSQGLHWYESRGLVSPHKINGYRKYSTDDLCLLSRIRLYHQIGFSTKEIDGLLSEDIDSVASTLDERIAEIEASIKKEQVILSVIEERAQLARNFLKQEGVFSLVQTDAFYFKHTFKVYKRNVKDPAPVIKAWADDIPLVQYASIAEIDKHATGNPSKIGLAYPEKYITHANKTVKEDIVQGNVPLIAGKRALYGLFSFTGLDSPQTYDVIKNAINVDLSSLEGTMIWRPISCRKTKESVVSYWEIWLPLSEY